MRAPEIVATTGDAAFATDEKGRIVLWNEAAEHLLGYAAVHVVGRPCHQVLCGTDVYGNPYCSANCVLLRAARERRPVRRFELNVKTACGVRVRTAISMVRVETEKADGATFLHLFHPVVHRDIADDGNPERASGGIGGAQPMLTARELGVLKLVADGMGTDRISEVLSISPATVRTHVRNILAKLEVHSKLEAVCVALRRGMF